MGWGETIPKAKKAVSWLVLVDDWSVEEQRGQGCRLLQALFAQQTRREFMSLPRRLCQRWPDGRAEGSGVSSRVWQAAQRGNAWFLGDPGFVFSLSFLCCPILLTSTLSLFFFSIFLLLKWLLYTGLSWSLSEIDAVRRTYPWVFKAMTSITKVSLC